MKKKRKRKYLENREIFSLLFNFVVIYIGGKTVRVVYCKLVTMNVHILLMFFELNV